MSNTLTPAERERLAAASPGHLVQVEALEGRVALFRAQVCQAMFPHQLHEAQARLDEAEGELQTVVAAVRSCLAGKLSASVAASSPDDQRTPTEWQQLEIDALNAKFRRLSPGRERDQLGAEIALVEGELLRMRVPTPTKSTGAVGDLRGLPQNLVVPASL